MPPNSFRPIPSAIGLPEPVRVAINLAFEAMTGRIDMVQVECMRESRETLVEVRSIHDTIGKETRAGWESVIDAMRKPITIPSPPPNGARRDAADALGVMRARQPTLSEIVLAVDEEHLKRDGQVVADFKKAVRKGMHEGTRKAIALIIPVAVAALGSWVAHDLLPHTRVLPPSTVAEPSLAPAPSK